MARMIQSNVKFHKIPYRVWEVTVVPALYICHATLHMDSVALHLHPTWQVNEGFGQHHKDKAATLHVVPEYEEEEDDALAAAAGGRPDVAVTSTSTSTDPLPIPRARQAFVPRSSADSDGSTAGNAPSLPAPLPSPSASINPAAHYASARWSARLTFSAGCYPPSIAAVP